MRAGRAGCAFVGRSVARRLAPSFVIAAALSGCTRLVAPVCAPPQHAALVDSLYFGTAREDGPSVTPDEFQRFLEGIVTPRFPQGLTSWPAAGQWRSPDGRLIEEASHVLVLVHEPDPASERAIAEIIERYKKDFQQRSVLRVRSSACASF